MLSVEELLSDSLDRRRRCLLFPLLLRREERERDLEDDRRGGVFDRERLGVGDLSGESDGDFLGVRGLPS